MKYKYQILLGLAFICFLVSLILVFNPISELCGETGGCKIVQTSDFSSLFGLEISYYGVLAFSILMLITFSHIIKPNTIKKKIILTLTIIGSTISLFLISAQIFILKNFCAYCLVIDICMFLCLAVIFLKENENNTPRSRSNHKTE